MPRDARYLLLPPDSPLPDLAEAPPFVAFVIVRAEVTTDWQWAVSQWLVASGCLSMAAWGIACTTWDDSVDEANLVSYDWGEIPAERAVMTSWHANDTLEEATLFARHVAFHPTRVLEHAVILDITHEDREAEVLGMWARA